MKKAIRKGVKLRYIGNNPLAQGQIFTVRHKSYSHVEVLFPCKYLDGSVHGQVACIPISDFEMLENQ